jgi:ketosteroid isomerase-like protein
MLAAMNAVLPGRAAARRIVPEGDETIETTNGNVETYRRIIEAWNAGGIEGVLPYYDETIEIYDPDLPGEGTYRGHDGARQVFEQLAAGGPLPSIKDWDLVPSGDRVVGLLHTHWRDDKAGELDVEVRDAHTLTFRDGKVVYWRMYLDRSEALSDAGLDADARPLS